MNMQIKLKGLFTNWLNILGVFLVIYLYAFLSSYIGTSFSLFQAFVSALILVCLYGIVFWIGFIIAISVLDVLIINRNLTNLKVKLIIEWLVISSPFIYWIIKYHEWIFLSGVIAFLITQMLRHRLILKVVQ